MKNDHRKKFNKQKISLSKGRETQQQKNSREEKSLKVVQKLTKYHFGYL